MLKYKFVNSEPIKFLLHPLATTSCGLTLKLLRKTPIFTCGNNVVMLTAPPGGNNSSSSRSIFNAGSGLSAARSETGGRVVFGIYLPHSLAPSRPTFLETTSLDFQGSCEDCGFDFPMSWPRCPFEMLPWIFTWQGLLQVQTTVGRGPQEQISCHNSSL